MVGRRTHLWRDALICSAIILVYLWLGWFHWRFVMVPAKPDEIAHLVYIADVLQGHLWPVMAPHPKAPCPLDERFQPPLYYWISALVLWPSPIGWPEDWVVANPFFLVGAPQGNATPCLHFPQGTAPLMAGWRSPARGEGSGYCPAAGKPPRGHEGSGCGWRSWRRFRDMSGGSEDKSIRNRRGPIGEGA